MKSQEFSAWRQRVGLSQEKAAEKIGVTRTTIQNWEAGATAIPHAVETSCQIWEDRLKQENPDLGPVTLVYSDGPMFVNPYGPGRRPAMMHREPYPTNAAALARVQTLWGRDDFHNPFIIEASGKPLWNVVELQRVVSGSDKGAPTMMNLLRGLAGHVRATSGTFVRTGPRLLSPSETKTRTAQIEALADRLETLATAQDAAVDVRQVEQVLAEMRSLGKHPPESLINNIAQAAVAREQPVGEPG
jgi:Helix-turn-helix